MDLVQNARENSIAAQSQAGVRIQTLTQLAELNDARLVFDAVWPSLGGSTQVQSNLMKALVHAGGYCAAAYVGEQPVGAALGFIGHHRDEAGNGHVHLHSHMAAVLEPYRDRHIGAALKVHQRWWALDQNIDVIMWTFDPLVRRNARLNLIKLGTEVRGYEVNFYGEMDDAINAGDPSDRMFAWWEVGSTRAIQAAAGELAPVDIAQLRSAGRDAIEIAVPDDIVQLRATNPAAAQEWREQVRAAFLDSAQHGYVITGVSLNGNYVLERS
jgi:predicted GNAT superfamily acetyltransferase